MPKKQWNHNKKFKLALKDNEAWFTVRNKQAEVRPAGLRQGQRRVTQHTSQALEHRFPSKTGP